MLKTSLIATIMSENGCAATIATQSEYNSTLLFSATYFLCLLKLLATLRNLLRN